MAVTLAALVAAGCSSDADDGGGAPVAGETALEVTLDIDGEGGESARTETIACESGSGCDESESLGVADFEPVAPQTPCTEIFGGPEIVTISGTLNGEPVDAQLSRANGCEIDRFDRFIPMLQALFSDYRPGEALAP